MPSWVTCSEIILYFNVNYYPNKTEHFGIGLYLKPVTSNFLLDLENFHLWYTLTDLQYYNKNKVSTKGNWILAFVSSSVALKWGIFITVGCPSLLGFQQLSVITR